MKKQEIKKIKSGLPKNTPKFSEKNNAIDVKPGVSGLQKVITKGTKKHRKKNTVIVNPLQMSHLPFLLHQILKTRWKKRISVVVKVILLFLRVPTVNSIFLHFRLWRSPN